MRVRASALVGLLVAVAVGLAAPSALGDASVVLASGQIGQSVWQLYVPTHRSVLDGRRGYCVEFTVGDTTVPAVCSEPKGYRRGIATVYGGNVRGDFALVNVRATRVVITLNNRHVLRASTVQLPPSLHPGAKLAWVVVGGRPKVIGSRREDPCELVAYDRAGRVVGRLGLGSPPVSSTPTFCSSTGRSTRSR